MSETIYQYKNNRIPGQFINRSNSGNAQFLNVNNSGNALFSVAGSSYGVSGEWILGTDNFGYQPAWTYGTLTWPSYNDNIGIDNPNLLLTTYSGSSGIYISQYDSVGNDQSVLLSSITSSSGTITFTQGLNNITFGFVPNTFTYSGMGFNSLYYDPSNSPLTLVSTSNTGFTGYPYGDNNAGPLTYVSSGIPPNNSELVVVTIVVQYQVKS